MTASARLWCIQTCIFTISAQTRIDIGRKVACVEFGTRDNVESSVGSFGAESECMSAVPDRADGVSCV